MWDRKPAERNEHWMARAVLHAASLHSASYMQPASLNAVIKRNALRLLNAILSLTALMCYLQTFSLLNIIIHKVQALHSNLF
jgi:hypothetical protein